MTQQSGRRTREGRKILVRPTAPKETSTTQYTDISLTGLLSIHAGQINAARDMLWRRYGFFLLVNSIFFPLLTRAEVPVIFQSAGATVAIYICWTAYMALRDDRQVLISRIRLASNIRWSHLPPNANVFVFALLPEELAIARRVYSRAAFIVWIFFVLYAGVCAYHVWPLATLVISKMGL